MKRIVCMLFVALTLCTDSWAQNELAEDSIEITFNILTPKENSLTSEQRTEIKSVLEAVLARTESSGAVGETPFVIIPDIKNVSTDMTEGSKEAFLLIKGELVLIAKNRYDGISCQESSIPLKELVEVEKADDPKLLLIRSINPKDRRFVRFIRTTQRRIVEKYRGSALEVP